ncbi:unnamed protein product, partial [Nesidiocoris tenuis]
MLHGFTFIAENTIPMNLSTVRFATFGARTTLRRVILAWLTENSDYAPQNNIEGDTATMPDSKHRVFWGRLGCPLLKIWIGGNSACHASIDCMGKGLDSVVRHRRHIKPLRKIQPTKCICYSQQILSPFPPYKGDENVTDCSDEKQLSSTNLARKRTGRGQ